MKETIHRIGVISDTHGLLRDEVPGLLNGCELIIHAGDIGSLSILDQLNQIAPVVAVRGNVDRDKWTEYLPKTEFVEVGDLSIYLIHDLKELDLDPVSADIQVVISGHSHKPMIKEEKGVMYLNPGSAGPRRFNLPISIAILQIDRLRPSAEIITIAV